MIEEKPAQVRTIQTEKLEQATLEYFITQTSKVPAQYGAAIRMRTGGGLEEMRIADVTADASCIEALVLALADGTVTPCTMRDVVEDWLNGR